MNCSGSYIWEGVCPAVGIHSLYHVFSDPSLGAEAFRQLGQTQLTLSLSRAYWSLNSPLYTDTYVRKVLLEKPGQDHRHQTFSPQY